MKELKWYAVYTRPKWEKKVAEQLTRKKINNYCPLNKVQQQWSDRGKMLYEPLFASYVFVQLVDKDSASVLQATGVVNFVYWLGSPVIIRDEEIDAIRSFVSEYSNITTEKKLVNLNGEVTFINGPLISRKGNVLEVRNSTVKVLLPSLGHMLIAETRKDSIEMPSYIGESKLRI
jgi:transcription antitermination factor NusG